MPQELTLDKESHLAAAGPLQLPSGHLAAASGSDDDEGEESAGPRPAGSAATAAAAAAAEAGKAAGPFEVRCPFPGRAGGRAG